MRTSSLIGLTFVFTAALTVANGQTNQKDAKAPKDTVIHIEDFDCEACGVIVELALKELKGVAKVKLDFEEETATVVTEENKTVSAKLMWEAVEECGFKPTKLIGPGGTFTKKPPS